MLPNLSASQMISLTKPSLVLLPTLISKWIEGGEGKPDQIKLSITVVSRL